jgi:hypothetical protein
MRGGSRQFFSATFCRAKGCRNNLRPWKSWGLGFDPGQMFNGLLFVAQEKFVKFFTFKSN